MNFSISYMGYPLVNKHRPWKSQIKHNWLVVSNILYFPFHIWDVILPIDIFQRDWNHQPGNTRLCNLLHSRFDWLCYHFLVFFSEGYLRSDMNLCCQGGLLWIVIILDIRLTVKTKPGFVYCKSVWSWNVLDDSHLPLDFIILFFVDGVDTQHQLGLCPNMGHI